MILKCRHKLFILLIVLTMIFGVIPVTVAAVGNSNDEDTTSKLEKTDSVKGLADDGKKMPISSNDNTEISIHWTSGELDEQGNAIYYPNNNGFNYSGSGDASTAPCSAKGQIAFSISGSKVHQPGEIKIYIPKQIFIGRNNEYIDKLQLGIPKKPAIGVGDYNYYIENDTIVIQNIRPVSDGVKATIDYSYDIQRPSQFISGNSSELLQAKIEIEDSEVGTVTAYSNSIQAKVITKAKLSSVRKYGRKGFMQWQESWGEKPSDADDYVYYIWEAIATVSPTVNQPFSITFNEVDFSNYITSEVVGYSKITNNINNEAYVNGPFDSKITPIQIDTPVSCASYYPSKDTTNFHVYVLMRYKKDEFRQNYKHKLYNSVEATVTGLDDSIASRKKSSEAQIQFGIMNFTAPPGDEFSLSKAASKSYYGGLEELLNDREFVAASFSIRGRASAYKQTMGDGMPADQPESYGVNPYRLELVDDYVFIEGTEEPLSRGIDYEIAAVQVTRPYIKEYLKNQDTGEYLPTDLSDYSRFPEELVYGKYNGKWELIAKTKIDNNGVMQIEPVMSGVSEMDRIVNIGGNGYTKTISIPKGCESVKITMEGAFYSMDTNACGVLLRLKPTKKVKELAEKAMENEEPIKLHNVNTMLVYNKKDEQIGFYGTAEGYGKEEIKQADVKQYGAEMYHASSSVTLKDNIKSSSFTKKTTSIKNDTSERKFVVEYLSKLEESIVFNEKNDTIDSLKDKGVIQDEKGGVFYDLLPLGMNLKNASLRYMNEQKYNMIIPSSVSVINNWKDTNRTMVVVSFDQTVPWVLSDNNSGKLAIYLEIIAEYSWDNLIDYGNSVINSVAYKTGNNSIWKGYPDTGGQIKEAEVMNDIDNDGNPEGTANRYLYAESSDILSGLVSTNAGVTKHVKGSNDTSWQNSVTIDANEPYQYRLRYSNSEHTKSDSIVLFDSLENFELESEHPDSNRKKWKGIFEGIDVSQAEKIGIQPVVYYSTEKNLDISKNKDLTDRNIWTKTKPVDNKSIYAVAIDLSKDKSGEKFILPESRAVSIFINMKAPDVYKSNHYNNLNAIALNQVFANSHVTDTLGGTNETKLIHNEFTKVNLNKQLITIPVTKVWQGDNNPSGSVTVELYINGKASGQEVELNANNSWKSSFYNVEEYNADGSLNIFDVKEKYLYADKYLTKVSGDYKKGFIITNTRKTYNVTYIVNEDAVYGKPTDCIEPEDNTKYNYEDTVTVADELITEQKFAEIDGKRILGKWEFISWDKKDFNIKENTIITGAWVFTPSLGELTVSKTISGNDASATQNFMFTVTLNDATVSGKYGDMQFENGVATFTLKANERKTATGIRNGIGYTISESNNDGYIVTVNGQEQREAIGTIIADEKVFVDFNNHKDRVDGGSNHYDNTTKPDNPNSTNNLGTSDDKIKTGDNRHVSLWFIIACLSLSIMIVMFANRKYYSVKRRK